MDDLYKQYEELTDEEKNALIIYKSRLGLLINDLDNNPNFEYYYNHLQVLLSNPLNMLTKTTVFNTINFSSLDTFKTSIYHIKDILDEATSKLITNQDMTVYRSISSNNQIIGLSKGNIISTSLSFGTTLEYAVAGENIKLYEIHIPAGSKVAVVPYSILTNKNNTRLILSRSSNNDEIILNSNNYTFEEIDKNTQEGYEIITIKAYIKDNIKNK